MAVVIHELLMDDNRKLWQHALVNCKVISQSAILAYASCRFVRHTYLFLTLSYKRALPWKYHLIFFGKESLKSFIKLTLLIRIFFQNTGVYCLFLQAYNCDKSNLILLTGKLPTLRAKCFCVIIKGPNIFAVTMGICSERGKNICG